MTAQRGAAALEQELSSRLGYYIKRAEQALMAEKTRVLRVHGLTVAQYSALMTLRYVPESSAAQLSRACAVTPQTMATILGNLEQKGLISREPSPMHLRVLSTRITPAGAVIAGQADEAAKNVERKLGLNFSDTEIHLLKRLLDRAALHLHAQTETAGADQT